MTGKEIALIQTEDSPLELFRPGGEDMLEALSENVGGDQIAIHELAQVRVPSGGGGSFQIEGSGGDTEMKEIVGVPLGFLPEGQLWGHEEMAAGEQPVLVTHDLKFAYMLNTDIGDLDPSALDSARVEGVEGPDTWYDWSKLPYTQFGTSKTGKGKRAKEMRVVPILLQDRIMPFVVRIPSASVMDCDRFRRNAFSKAFYYHLVRITLEKVPASGSTPAYAKTVFELLPGMLTREQAQEIKTMYVENLRAKHYERTLSM